MSKTRIGTWSHVVTELGTGIECSICHRKIGGRSVVMGDDDLNTCKFCGNEMKPIAQKVLNQLKDEFESNKAQ